LELREEALEKPEVAGGDAFDGGDGLRVGDGRSVRSRS